MKKIYLLVVLICLFNRVNADSLSQTRAINLQKNFLSNKVELKKSNNILFNRKLNKLIGFWSLKFGPTDVVMEITKVSGSSQGGIFTYNLFTSDGEFFLGLGLEGFVDGKDLYFTFPGLTADVTTQATFNKRFTRASVISLLYSDRDCIENIVTGLFECDALEETNIVRRSGSMSKLNLR